MTAESLSPRNGRSVGLLLGAGVRSLRKPTHPQQFSLTLLQIVW